MNELPNSVVIEDNNVEIRILSSYNGLLGWYYLFTEHMPYPDIGNGLIFTTKKKKKNDCHKIQTCLKI